MSKFKIIFIKTFLVLLTFQCLNVDAKDFHAILVGDTSDYSVGRGVEINIKNMEAQVEQIAELTGMKLQLHKFVNDKYNSSLPQSLKMLPIKEGDVVLFYYSGHGYHPTSKQDKWPNIYISKEHKGIDYNTIIEVLDEKNPDFLLSLVNCCNSYYNGWIPVVKSLKSIDKLSKKSMQTNYQKLFLETTGKIISCSSSVGQYSWINLHQGDWYTNAFLDCLETEAALQTNPDWNVVMETTKNKTYTDVLYAIKKKQLPLIETFDLVQ